VAKSASQHPAKEGKGSFLKAVGAVAAVVSLFLALNQVTGLVQQLRIHHKEFSETMNSGEQQMQREDYSLAYRSFKHAAELDPIDRGAQEKETQAAMLWLENADATEKHSFTDVADQLLPVFDSALMKAKGQAAGDILAHVAWANFLKYREGGRQGTDVDGNLKAAFAADPSNVYAHAMSGLWILWTGGDIKSAEAHFNAALATGRVKNYVRDMQLSALQNSSKIENDAEEFRVANDMRKAGETMPSEYQGRIFWNDFASHFHDRDALSVVLKALPPTDAEATYDWLDGNKDGKAKTWNREFVMANLKEITGDTDGALSAYETLQKQMKNSDYSLLSVVDVNVKRLSHLR